MNGKLVEISILHESGQRSERVLKGAILFCLGADSTCQCMFPERMLTCAYKASLNCMTSAEIVITLSNVVTVAALWCKISIILLIFKNTEYFYQIREGGNNVYLYETISTAMVHPLHRSLRRFPHITFFFAVTEKLGCAVENALEVLTLAFGVRPK